MLPPIKKTQIQFNKIKRNSKTSASCNTGVTDVEANSEKTVLPLKGQIKQLVFNILIKKFGDKMANEPEFMKMVDSICDKIEPKIVDSSSLQQEVSKYLKINV